MIETRWATPTDAAAMQRFAKELAALQPDVILASTTPTTTALLQQTRTIPIVFATVGDPIGSGFVVSFPRPGGNATNAPGNHIVYAMTKRDEKRGSGDARQGCWSLCSWLSGMARISVSVLGL